MKTYYADSNNRPWKRFWATDDASAIRIFEESYAVRAEGAILYTESDDGRVLTLRKPGNDHSTHVRSAP